MNCYGSPIAALPPLDRWVLNTVKAARGFYRRSGVTAADIDRAIRYQIARTDPRGRALHGLPRNVIGLALARLARRGMISRGTRGWRVNG